MSDGEAVVTTNGSGGRLFGVGHSHEIPAHVHSALSGPLHRNHRARGDELQQFRKERLLNVFCIVAKGQRLVDVEPANLLQIQTFSLKTGNDLADQASRHAVGLDHDKCVFGSHCAAGYLRPRS